MNGNKSITGGVMEDEFNIKAEYIFGYLNGSDGEDVADFSASDAGKDLVIQRGEAFFSPKHGNNHTLKLYSIESIIGRQGLSDFIEVCNEKKIDFGGSTYEQDQMTLLNVTIYPHLSEVSHCYIDLRDLAQELHKYTKGGFGLSIRSKHQAEDIVLKIYILSNTERNNKANFKGQIVIKDGYKYADRIKVHLYGENSFVNFMDTVLLKPSSLHVNRSFVTLFAGNVDFNCEINFQYSAENLKPYRLDKSLLLTNVLPLEKASTGQPIKVVLIDYSAYQAKYDTFSLIFDGKNLNLTTLVKHTKDIQSLWIDINEAIKDPEIVAPVAKEGQKGKIQIA
uniref:Uncharacterized protein n=1 Tax=Romanomermis culicivorax TaxID=13658 RepID=A0A915KVL9_ROMCU